MSDQAVFNSWYFAVTMTAVCSFGLVIVRDIIKDLIQELIN